MGGGGRMFADLATGGAYSAINPANTGDPKSAKQLEKKAATKAEDKRLSRSAAKKEKGQTKFASAPSMGMNLKNKMGQ